jgi:tRNA splicing ligase
MPKIPGKITQKEAATALRLWQKRDIGGFVIEKKQQETSKNFSFWRFSDKKHAFRSLLACQNSRVSLKSFKFQKLLTIHNLCASISYARILTQNLLF